MPIASKMFIIKNFIALKNEKINNSFSKLKTAKYKIAKKLTTDKPVFRINTHLENIILSFSLILERNCIICSCEPVFAICVISFIKDGIPKLEIQTLYNP